MINPRGEPCLSPHSLLTVRNSVRLLLRGGRVLAIDPETANWLVFEERYLPAFHDLRQGTDWSAWREGISSKLCPEEGEGFILELYHSCIIEIDGESYVRCISQTREARYRLCLLNVTEACNLRCRYCQAACTTGPLMNLETMKRSIDLAMGLPTPKVIILFFGGEPLLAGPVIMEAIKYGIERSGGLDKQVDFGIQTNALLLDEAMMNFVASYRVGLGVSLDGTKRIHDSNRIFPNGEGSFDLVSRKVEELQARGISFSVISVVSTSADMMECFHSLVSRGISQFKFNIRFPMGRALHNDYDNAELKAMALAYLQVFEEIIEHNLKYGTKIGLGDIDNMLLNIICSDRYYKCLSPCGAGTTQLVIDTNGDVYPCDRLRDKGFRLGSIYQCGNLADMVTKSWVVRNLRQRVVDNIPVCRDCTWKHFCGGECTGKTVAKFGTLFHHSPMCQYLATIYEELIWKLSSKPGRLLCGGIMSKW